MMAPRRYRDPLRPADMKLVMDAAGALGLGEFELFGLAWKSWSGGEADEKALERYFVAYMFRRAAPPWVRHFCRQVLEQERQGRLDRRDFGLAPIHRRETTPGPGRIYVGFAVAAALLLYPALINLHPTPRAAPGLACELGPGMAFYARLAQALAGRPAPACPARDRGADGAAGDTGPPVSRPRT